MNRLFCCEFLCLPGNIPAHHLSKCWTKFAYSKTIFSNAIRISLRGRPRDSVVDIHILETMLQCINVYSLQTQNWFDYTAILHLCILIYWRCWYVCIVLNLNEWPFILINILKSAHFLYWTYIVIRLNLKTNNKYWSYIRLVLSNVVD